MLGCARAENGAPFSIRDKFYFVHDDLLRPSRSPLQLNWSNSVVIFDEAHNLENVASEAASFELTSAQVAGAQEEALRCHKILTEGGGGVDEVRPAAPYAREKARGVDKKACE